MLKVLSIGYGRNLFQENDRERKRLEACAAEVDELHVIVFTNKKQNLEFTLGENNLYLYPTKAGTFFSQLFLALRLSFSILNREVKNDWVITAQDPFETGLLAFLISKLKKIPFNVQEHGDFYSTNFWRKDSILNQFRYRLGKFILRRSDTVRVVSERIKNIIFEIGIPKCKVFKLAVRTDHVFDENTLPYQYGFPGDSVVVLTIARLVTQKNLSLLIKSFAKVLNSCSEARLVIVGSGPEKEKLQKLQKDLNLEDKVRFYDWSDNPVQHLKAADIYALSSNWEGWARVLIEAMVVGLPIITTDVGCANEVVKNDKHGFVVPVNDESAFTQKLLELVKNKNLRKEFSNNSIEISSSLNMSEKEYALAWQKVLQDTKNRGYK